MNFLEKLDYLMSVNGLNKSTLSSLSGVPYTTIDALYKKGFENIKMSTIKKLASSLNVSLDYLMDDSISAPDYGKKVDQTVDDRLSALVALYNQMDEAGRESLLGVMRAMKKNK